jgi:Fe-S cluster assembly protein SufD
MTNKVPFSSTALFGSLVGAILRGEGEKDGMVRKALGDLAWPTVKDEDWKYSDLSPLAKRSFETVSRQPGYLPDEARPFFREDFVNLVFCNGLFSQTHSELSRLPYGLIISRGHDAVAQAQKFKPYFNGKTGDDPLLFLSLNQALSKDCILLNAEKDVAVKKPVQILHIIDGAVEKIAFFPKFFIHLAPSSQLDVLETTICLGSGEYLSNPVTEALVEKNASLNHIQVHAHSAAAFHVGSTRIWIKKDGHLNSFVATSGARIFRSHVNAILEGEGAHAVLNGLHALKDERHADSHTFIHHVAPNAKSNQLYKCILDGESHSVFNGKVLVDQAAQLTNSYQLNKNLLLSRDCHADTKPELRINADDVKCTHGATIGQLNDEEIFYLETRGIAKAEAQRMLTRGFVDDVVNKITNPLLRSVVSQLIPI